MILLSRTAQGKGKDDGKPKGKGKGKDESGREVRASRQGSAILVRRSTHADPRATHAGKPRAAYPTITRLLIHVFCAMNLENPFGYHEML